VLKPGLVIYGTYNGYWFRGPPVGGRSLARRARGTREIRADWDLSTPGLREAWNVGDMSTFRGWNKRGTAKAPQQ
jgi:hypothetical protein